MLNHLLKSLAALVVLHPRLTIGVYLALAAAAVPVAMKIDFRTDQNDLVAADLEYNRRYLDFLEEFGDLEFLYVVIEVGDDERAALAAARDTRERVESLEEHVDWALHRVPAEALRYGILHRDEEELKTLGEALAANSELLGILGKTDRLENLFAFFSKLLDPGDISKRFEGGSWKNEGFAAAAGALSLMEHSLKTTLDTLEGRQAASLARLLEEEQGGSLRERGYLATENGKFLLVEILPKKNTSTLELIREPLLEIRRELAEVRRSHPGVQLGLTGRPVLQADEMMTTDKDMKRATLAALMGVFALFVIFFRRLGRPFLCILTLSVAILLTFALATLAIGHLTLLSIVFAAMLVGLGIDFGIHFTARYQEELERQGSVEDSVRRTIETTGLAIVVGGVTTAAAFYMTLFVDFKGLRELGLIAGSGVLVCLFSMITLLPALIVLFDSRTGKTAHAGAIRVPLLEFSANRPIPVLVIAAIVTASGAFFLEGLPYNPNLLELQAQNLDSVKYERKLIENSAFSTWYAAFIVHDLDEVRDRLNRLDAIDKDVISRTESVLDYIPGEQAAKLARLEPARESLAAIVLPAAIRDVEVESLATSVEQLQGNLFDLADTISQSDEEAARQFAGRLLAAADLSGEVVDRLRKFPESKLADLGAFQESWIGEVNGLLGSLQSALLEKAPITAGNLPEILRNRLVSRDGEKFIVYAYANGDLW